jgi:L-threonylcarbamoyladenylate synthase
MKTRFVRLTDEASKEYGRAMSDAADLIRRGRLVAFPTETVYGLGANALDATAAAKIFEAKQRALNDPLIVHVDNSDLSGLVDFSVLPNKRRVLANKLIDAFWPGPLTLVLPRGERVPLVVSAGLDTVAIRMPNHPIALELIRRAGVPIAAPSANRFAYVSPTTAQHVLDDLDGRIDLVLDGGATPIGVESTVLSLVHQSPTILRHGGVTREMLKRIHNTEYRIQKPRNKTKEAQMSPGMVGKHYAPRAKLVVVDDLDDLLIRRTSLVGRQVKVGALLLKTQAAACAHMHPQYILGETIEDAARNLYAGLRALDATGVEVILVVKFESRGLGAAIADRLEHAAAYDE